MCRTEAEAAAIRIQVQGDWADFRYVFFVGPSARTYPLCSYMMHCASDALMSFWRPRCHHRTKTFVLIPCSAQDTIVGAEVYSAVGRAPVCRRPFVHCSSVKRISASLSLRQRQGQVVVFAMVFVPDVCPLPLLFHVGYYLSMRRHVR